MFPPAVARPLSSVAILFVLACEASAPADSDAAPERPMSAAALATYFPTSEASGGWRSTTDAGRIGDLGMNRDRIEALGRYLTSLPYENYQLDVSGYKPSNKAAIVLKDGWIVGEYYNQAGASSALYYLSSNSKSVTMLLAGHLAQTYPGLGFGTGSKLYDRRWLAEGFPLTDSRKADITIDHVFRHSSGIVPEDEHQIADGAVQAESDWSFAPFTVGRDADWPQSARLYYAPGNPSGYSGESYSSVAFNHLSLLFRNVTGKEASVYLNDAILDRIGVGRDGYRLTSGMGSTKWATAGNLLLTARDFLRLGYLMLHEGDWSGRRIFAAAWLRRFTGSSAYKNIRSNKDCYWGAKYPADLYRTTGSGENWVLVVPSLDLILSFNGRTPRSKRAEIDRESLQRLFAAVTERYVACDGTVVNGN
jgi:CubicO group peptidase (beta-lactamase class C family)